MRATGKVKFFDVKKGFGFIIPDEGGVDVFFHRKDVLITEGEPPPAIPERQKVEFEIVVSTKGDGRKAINVALA